MGGSHRTDHAQAALHTGDSLLLPLCRRFKRVAFGETEGTVNRNSTPEGYWNGRRISDDPTELIRGNERNKLFFIAKQLTNCTTHGEVTVSSADQKLILLVLV
jgi:hypothetical protein